MRSIRILTGLILAASVTGIAALIILRTSGPDVAEAPPTSVAEPSAPAESPAPGTADKGQANAPKSAEEQTATQVRLFGTVIDAKSNAAIQDARIVARDGESETEASTDENGAFILEAPPARNGVVTCNAQGYTPFELTYSGDEGDSVRLDFQLRPGSSIAGRITDANSGEAVVGVTVRLLGSQENVFDLMRGGRSAGGSRSAKTDEEGAYQIEGIPPAPYRVTLDTSDTGYLFRSENSFSLDVAEAMDYEGVDFTLERGGSVTGTVTGNAGIPVEDATVILMPAQMLRAAFRGMDTLDPSAFQPKHANTDGDGNYTVRGVDYDSEMRVVVQSDEFARAQSDVFALSKAVPDVRVDMTLSPGSAIEGTAHYPDGAPASAVRLILFPGSGENWQGFMGPGLGTTDAEGKFRIEHVNAGSYLLRPERDLEVRGFKQTTDAVNVSVDGKTDVKDIEVVVQHEAKASEGTGTIAGIVLDPSGSPAGGVRVDAKRVDNPRETAGGTTEPDGRFELAKLRGIAYDINVNDAMGIAKQSTVAVGSEITIRLESPALVGGVVVNATGEPVQGANVSLKDLGKSGPEPNMAVIMQSLFRQERGGKTTDAYGRFEFAKVAPGDYKVEAKTAAEGTAETDPLTVTPGMERTDLRLVLDPGVTFGGIVLGSSGEPVRGAHVQLTPSGEDPTMDMMSQFLPAAMLNPAGSTTSDENGLFEIHNVPPGTYKLVATHSAYAKTVMPDVAVPRGRNVTGFRVVLSKGGKAQGRYTVDGKAQPGAMIMIVGPAGFEMVQTDSQGMFDVTGLSSGPYMIAGIDPSKIASAGQGMQFRPEIVDIANGEVTDVDLGGAGGVPVTGVVSGAGDGLTVVALRRPGGPALENLDLTNLGNLFESMRYLAGQSAIAPDGSFTIDGVEPGDYILEVYTIDMNQAGPDLTALMNMPRTPAYRQNVTIGIEPPVVNVSLEQR